MRSHHCQQKTVLHSAVDRVGSSAIQVVAKLHKHSAGSKSNGVKSSAVAPLHSKALKIFEVPVHNLMPSLCCSLHFQIRPVEDSALVATGIITTIASITLHHFAGLSTCLRLRRKIWRSFHTPFTQQMSPV